MRQNNSSGEKQQHHYGLKTKMLVTMLPIIIITYLFVCICTYLNTQQILTKNLGTQIELTADTVSNEMDANIKKIVGIIESLKTSAESSCSTEKEIKDYIYSISDAYPDTIPAGVYCGLRDGTFVDKLWTPEPGWDFTERPWYQNGVKSDEVAFGEAYVDSDTGKYIISVFTNIKNDNDEVVGVISADIQLDSITSILTDKTILSDGYIYALDASSGMIFGNKKEENYNGKLISEIEDDTAKKITEMLDKKQFAELVTVGSNYIYLEQIKGTNFVTVSVVPVSDVTKSLSTVKTTSFFVSIIGIIIQCLFIVILLNVFLKPISKINGLMKRMHHLDMTERIQTKSKDELGQIAGNLNDLAIQLSETMQQFRQSIMEIDKLSGKNLLVSEQMDSSAENQFHSMEDLTTTMNELSDAITTIADGATKLAEHVSETTKAAGMVEEKLDNTMEYVESGKQNMNTMTEMMASISSISGELQIAVNNVRNGLDGINQMVTVITDIADQTNLLSLNASIEAARAGEAGKGFAVVADEIRTLAESCSNSAIDIVNTTKEMDGMVHVVLEKTENSIQAIQEGNGVVANTDETFQQILSNMTDIHQAINTVNGTMQVLEGVATDMAATTQEQTASSEVVLHTCEKIMDISKEFKKDGNTMVQVGNDLQGLSVTLKEQVDQFKITE